MIASALLGPSDAKAQAMADYTAFPPFTSSAVPPNILLLMDNSGSMAESAYHYRGTGTYDRARTYNGYFDQTQCYSYVSDVSERFSPAGRRPAGPSSCGASGLWDGNFLNWVAMNRMEITKWVMVGGKCAPRSIMATCPPGSHLQFENTSRNFLITVSSLNDITPFNGTCTFDRTSSNRTRSEEDPGDARLTVSGCTSKLESYRLAADTASEPRGLIQQVFDRARFGLMVFNRAAGSEATTSGGGRVLAPIGGNLVSMVNAIQNTQAETWTPLAESLYEATRYFAQIPPAYNPGNFSLDSPNHDPYFFTSPRWAGTSQFVPCCKSFVIIFTDGEPTQDTDIPASLQDYGHRVHGEHCGPPYYTFPHPPAVPCIPHKQAYPWHGRHFLDDVAYWAHVTDLRQATLPAINLDGSNAIGKDLPGVQNLTIYTFYAFGQPIGREILQTTAKAGGFEDRNGNNLPDLTEEWDRYNNYTGALGPDGLPDTYFESADADDLRDRLMATVTSILQRSASGTSVSVLATSSSGEGSIYQAYFFTSEIGRGGTDVNWTGYTHALFIDGFGNFREDTNQDGILDYRVDRIVTTRYDDNPASPTYRRVLVDKYDDLNGDGLADRPTPVVLGADLKAIIPIWEAGRELALTSSASRKILTWVDTNNNGIVDPGEQMDFSTANCNGLRDYLRYAGDACAGSSNAMNLINFIRGDEVAGLRTRMLEVPIGSRSFQVWKLGDPIHSTPTIVGAPKERYDLIYGDPTYNTFYRQYRNRRQVAYVGANDGMLHAFNAGYYHRGDNPATAGVTEHGWFTRTPTGNAGGPKLGAELWGFIPYQLLPQLQWLARPDYTHVYYVDLKPKVSDVRMFTPDADHPDGWGTILIGGFRMGGSCGHCAASSGAPPMTVPIGGTNRTFYSAYFVLDITNPEVDPKLLWVFTDSGLGLTTAHPAIGRVNPTSDPSTSKTNEKWYVIFGSGPNDYQVDLPSSPSQTAKFYVVDMVLGPGMNNSNVTTMPVGSVGLSRSFMNHIITVDRDLDYRVDVAYSGQTIRDGLLPWRGKLHRLTTGGCAGAPCSPSTWGVANGGNRAPTEVIDRFLDASLGTLQVGPITAAPTATIDDANMVWVFFGTGRYYGNLDKTDNNVQRLFGIKDSVLNGLCAQTNMVNCQANDLVDVTNAVVCLVCTASTNQVTDPTNRGVTTLNGTGTTSMVGLVQSKDGWRITLPIGSGINAAERSVVSPTLIGGTVFFPTFVPTNDFCASSGNSSLYALFYMTGTAAAVPVIGTGTSGSNVNITTKIALGVGMASSMSVQIGSQGSGGQGSGGTGGAGCSGGMTGAIQMSTGAATQPCTSAGNYYSKFVSWVHQRD